MNKNHEQQLLNLLAENDKKLVEKDVKLAEKDVKITQDARQITELKEFKDKFYITDIYKPYHTSGLPPNMVKMIRMMDEIIGNGEELYHFTWFNRDKFEEVLTRFDEIRVCYVPFLV